MVPFSYHPNDSRVGETLKGAANDWLSWNDVHFANTYTLLFCLSFANFIYVINQFKTHLNINYLNESLIIRLHFITTFRSRPHGSTATGTTAHNTLNSHGTHTLNSHSHTLSSHHSHTLSSSHGVNTISNSIHSSNGSHQQPDILKSTPDHQRIK